jgi:hypothetical protein
MFEFEDNDFTLMESFTLSANEDGDADFEDIVPLNGMYLGDGVWVVDAHEDSEEAEQVHVYVSES